VMNASLIGKNKDHIKFIAQNQKALAKKFGLEEVKAKLDIETASKFHERMKSARETEDRMKGLPKSAAFAVGDTVFARRRNRSDEPWGVGNIQRNWFEGEIIKVHQHDNPIKVGYDLRFLDGKKEKNTPRQLKKKSVDVNKEDCTVYLELIRTGRPDPALAELALSHNVGAVSEVYQEALEKFAQKNDLGKLLKKPKDIQKFIELAWTMSMRSMSCPGDAVGCVAAQSIGAESTQMTLNTFHLAGHGGANVTLGIPRLREIIMTASQNLKTPTMTVPMALGSTMEVAKAYARKISRVTLHELLHYENSIVVSETMRKNITWERVYDVTLTTENPDRISEVFGISFERIVKAVEAKLLLKIRYKVQQEQRRAGDKTSGKHDPLRKFMASTRMDRDEEGDHDAGNNNINLESGDGEGERRHSGPDQTQRLDAMLDGADDDEDDDANDDEEQGTLRLGSKKEVEAYDDDEDEKSDSGDGTDNDSDSSKSDDEDGEREKANDDTVTGSTFSIKSSKSNGTIRFQLTYPANARRLLMVQIVEQAALTVPVKETKGLNTAYGVEQEVGDQSVVAIQTEGVNFEALWAIPEEVVRHNELKSNDIYRVLLTYGVEAARQSIVNEILGVFGVYGINVNYRHLSLVADFMTRKGSYIPFNRNGMMDCPSPYLQMSFETTCTFLTKAACEGAVDTMESASAQIVLGQVPKVGTGTFDVMMPLAQ